MWLVSTSSVSGNLPFELKPGEYIVGRSRSAQIRIKDRTVSKEHARLVCRRNGITIEDLDSLNHTFINGREVKSGEAEIGDDVQFGAVRCRFSVTPMGEAESEESMSTVQVLPGHTLDIRGLTPAQQEILRLVLQGLNDLEIANKTDRSPGTVHTHMKAIYDYFKVHTRAQLMAKARKA